MQNNYVPNISSVLCSFLILQSSFLDAHVSDRYKQEFYLEQGFDYFSKKIRGEIKHKTRENIHLKIEILQNEQAS